MLINSPCKIHRFESHFRCVGHSVSEILLFGIEAFPREEKKRRSVKKYKGWEGTQKEKKNEEKEEKSKYEKNCEELHEEKIEEKEEKRK